MNLADIRKKAQKHAMEDRPIELPVPPLPPVTDEGWDGAPEEIPEPEVPVRENVPTAGTYRVETQILPGQGEYPAPVPGFDPLKTLLEGRERAWKEEELFDVSLQLELDSEVELEEFLCFRVASELYAINIMDIKEIIKPREVTEVPRVPEFVSGVLSLRGIIIPIFHLRHRLGLPLTSDNRRERIVVVKSGENFCGLLVDEVTQVVKINTDRIEQPPSILDEIDRDFVAGIGRHDGKMLILLNLEKILDVTLF